MRSYGFGIQPPNPPYPLEHLSPLYSTIIPLAQYPFYMIIPFIQTPPFYTFIPFHQDLPL